jgi:uncharacterized protein with GYD domain
MPYYLVQLSYTPEAWRALTDNPQDRQDAVTPLVERLGGRFVSTKFLCFGEYDLMAIVEMPDNVNAAAFSMTISAGGAVKAFRTTPLIPMAEGIAAMRQAGAAKAQYRGPAAKP